MDMSIIAADFDGSFGNPAVRIAVVVSAIVLAAVLIVVFGVVRSAWHRVVLSIIVLGIGEGFSRDAALTLVAFYYRTTAARPIDVGFFGGPPSWAAPVLALALVGLAALLVGRQPAGQSRRIVPPN